MKPLHKVILWCHLPVGVTAGIVVLIMSVTGVLLTYEREIIGWADSRGYHVTPSTSAPVRLPIETLIAKTREAQPGAVVTVVTLRADASGLAAIGLTGGRTVFINPYTGEFLG